MSQNLSSSVYPVLRCAVCGDNAGRWKQHPNRDTGYGVCRPCVDWLVDVRNTSPEQMKNDYGTAGVNYEDVSK